MSVVAFTAGAGAAVIPMPSPGKGDGALNTVRSRRLSGRPSCLIYPLGRGWRLALQSQSAWLMGMSPTAGFRFFTTLAAAIGFAQAHGLDYRIVRRASFYATRRRRRPERSRPASISIRSTSS